MFVFSGESYRIKSFFFTSDGTLNPNGVRFGSAEIYQIGKLE